MDEELLAAGIRKAVARRKKFTAHEDALDLYRRYVVVGGMPRAVEAYRENRSLRDARTVQAEIAETYAADIALYAPPRCGAVSRARLRERPRGSSSTRM